MDDLVIVDKVSRRFSIYRRASDFIWERILRRPLHDVLWALRDISVRVCRGGRLGIIGPNGSGKTTLLKIIVGNMPPTSGRVVVNGTISALLSQNWIVNPDETGIENIRFNLLLNGCPEGKVNEAIDDIIEFTELGPFIYHPVRTYSSGMNARLAFSMSTAVSPEILVIDEVLSVGDAYFVGKAMKRMVEFCSRGKALIFVSHDVQAVQRLCDTVLWLEQGMIREYGPAAQVLQHYEADYRAAEDQLTRASNAGQERRHMGTGEDDELECDVHSFRVVPQGSAKILGDTHFVRRIDVSGGTTAHESIGVGMDDAFGSHKSLGLEVGGCEWGRTYERGGVQSRMLLSQAGRRRGGRFVLRNTLTADEQVTIGCEATSMNKGQELSIEYLDLGKAEWVSSTGINRVVLSDGWERFTCTFLLRRLDEEDRQRGLAILRERERPKVEIEHAAFMINGRRVSVVGEHEPFDLVITVCSRRRVQRVSVGVKILRSDSTYVFWQPSGWDNNNILDLDGKADVTFHFAENYFSSGEYHVSVYCSDGWDPDHNYPYAEVFDRRVGLLTFRVQREFPAIDFGQINVRVPVSYIRHDHGVH